MAVRIRLARTGRKNRPAYRIGAFDSQTQRDGKVLENLGVYDPLEKDEAKRLVLKEDRVRYWIKQGAKPSEHVAALLKQKKIR